MVVQFRTTVLDSKTGDEIQSPRGIAFNYMTSFHFAFDLLAVFPFDNIFQSDHPICIF